MGKKKKPFIDKKHSVRFHLVHRDQRDPLQADADAPEMVLRAANETAGKEDEQKKFGIFFDDDYDYLQHLKPRGDGVLVMAENPNSSAKSPTSKDFSGIQIPTEALPSEFEEEEGMLGKGVLPRGPQPDWDPDIVEALDDGIDLDDPCNILEDDFVMLANGEGGISTQYNDYDDYDALSDRDFDSDDLASDDQSYDEFGHEETKSRFTNYSMTSSVMRRTEGLQLLDEQFEKVMEEYDDEEIGEMGCGDEGVLGKQDQILMEQAIDELAVKHDISNIRAENQSHVADKFADSGDSDDEHEEFEKHIEPEKEKWDCESIISTYSNIYNHPKLIKEPKPIKLTKRLGIPTDVLKKSNRGEGMETNFAAREEDSTVANHTRCKNETKEERKVRKTAVKEERRSRRSEKKANKIAFKDEQKIQERILASQPIKSTFSM